MTDTLEQLLAKHLDDSITEEEKERLSLLLQDHDYDGVFVEWLHDLFEQVPAHDNDEKLLEGLWAKIQAKIAAAQPC